VLFTRLHLPFREQNVLLAGNCKRNAGKNTGTNCGKGQQLRSPQAALLMRDDELLP